MDKEYKKVSDSEGVIVTTTSETVTLVSLKERYTQLMDAIEKKDRTILAETNARNSYIAGIEASKVPLQEELTKVVADIEGLTQVGVAMPEEEAVEEV